MFDKRVRNLIRKSMASEASSSQPDTFEPDWNGLLVEHLTKVRQKHRNKRRVIKAFAVAAAMILLTFSSLIVITSLDEIRAGDFNIIDAIRNLGNGIETRDLQQNRKFPGTEEKTFDLFSSYSEFIDKYPTDDYFKPMYVADGYILQSIEYTRKKAGITLLLRYYNGDIPDMYTIKGYFKNPDIEQSSHTVYPSSEHIYFDIDGIQVVLHKSSYFNVLVFEKSGVEFTVEYIKMTEDFPENLIRSIEIYGR